MLATKNFALLELWLPGATSYFSDSFDMLNDNLGLRTALFPIAQAL
jgi:hypothetical protein